MMHMITDEEFARINNVVEECHAEDRARTALRLQGRDSADPLAVQIGGDHYKKYAIQPVEYIHANGIGYFEGNVIKYVTRWRDKNGVADLEKARHYLDLLIELEGAKK